MFLRVGKWCFVSTDWIPWDEHFYHHGPPFERIHSPKTSILYPLKNADWKICVPLERVSFQGTCSSLSVYFLELVPSASKRPKSKKMMGLEEGSGGSVLGGGAKLFPRAILNSRGGNGMLSGFC